MIMSGCACTQGTKKELKKRFAIMKCPYILAAMFWSPTYIF